MKSITTICLEIESKIRLYDNYAEQLHREYRADGKTERQQANINKRLRDNGRRRLEWVRLLDDLKPHADQSAFNTKG